MIPDDDFRCDRARPPAGGPGIAAVTVHASDPMTKLGAMTILGANERVMVLADDDLAPADVIVVLEESIDHGVFAFLREARARSRLKPPPRCVIVTDQVPPEVLMTAIECGMAAMLQLHKTDDEESVRTVIAVSRGEAHLPPRLQRSLLDQLDRVRRDVLEPNGLTLFGPSARERDVLRLLADGYGTEEIAATLRYSTGTVKNVLHGLMTRYGLRSRAHAVAFAVRTAVI